ncbi:hypothetical protein AGLY_002024 [Aphis glycines]|uniref:Uncharacterized protein n=1 Tax=Aphis glycines TaxID=307491 RepID=A0A6G0U3Z0_APHGL|nr:hypothetical protein AGLY_002024 [Aphis glycines]
MVYDQFDLIKLMRPLVDESWLDDFQKKFYVQLAFQVQRNLNLILQALYVLHLESYLSSVLQFEPKSSPQTMGPVEYDEIGVPFRVTDFPLDSMSPCWKYAANLCNRPKRVTSTNPIPKTKHVAFIDSKLCHLLLVSRECNKICQEPFLSRCCICYSFLSNLKFFHSHGFLNSQVTHHHHLYQISMCQIKIRMQGYKIQGNISKDLKPSNTYYN